MSLSLYTNIQQKIPKKKEVKKDKGIYSNQFSSDNIYGIYTRYKLEYDHKPLDIYSKISFKYSNNLDLYSNIIETKDNTLDIFSNIISFDFSLGIYSYIEETKENQNLSFYTNISNINFSSLDLFTFVSCPDFIFTVYDQDDNIILENINWELYRRNKSISLNDDVNSSHILVTNGFSTVGLINIFLNDFNLKNLDNDYYLHVWKNNDIYHDVNLQISYFYENYIQSKKNYYIKEKLYLKKEGSGNGKETIIYQGLGGGGGTAQEVAVISRLISKQNIEVLCDLKEKITVKSKLISIKNINEYINIKFEGVKYV